MLIRRGRVDDARAIGEIHARSMKKAYGHLLSGKALRDLTAQSRRTVFDAHLAGDQDPGYRLWVAEIDGRLVAFADGGPCRDKGQDIASTQAAEIFDLWVDPEYWAQGIGRELLGRTLQDLHGDGFREVHIWAQQQSQRVDRFLTRAGWSWDGKTRVVSPDLPEMQLYRYRRALP